MRSMIALPLIFLLGWSGLYSAQQYDSATAVQLQQETETVSKILETADEASKKGDLATAIEKYREALTILEKKKDPQTTADTLYKLGVVLIKAGNFPDSHPALDNALELHQEINDQSATGFDLTSMAQLNFMEGNITEALALVEKALTIHKETQNKKGIAETLLVGGISYYEIDNYEIALDYCNRSLTTSTEIGNNPGIQQSLNMLGVIHWQQGDFDRALEFFQKAVPIAEQLSDPSGLSTLLSNMGLIYADKGEYNQALEYLNKGLEIDRKRGARQDIANSLYNISTVQGDQSNFEKARVSAQEALSIAEEIGEKSLIASCLDALGNFDFLLGNYDAALQHLERSAKISEIMKDKSGLAYVSKRIGTVYLRQEKSAQSLKYFQKALGLFEEIGMKRGVALTLNSLGNAHSKLGNYDKALQDFQKALSIAQAINTKPVETESYIGIGSAHYSISEMAEAEEGFTKSIEISREISHPHSLWRALHKKGLVCRDTGRPAEAVKLMEESVSVVERVRSELQLAEEKTGYFEDKLDVYEDLVRLLVATQDLSKAFEYAQRAKARSFLDMLAEARIDPDGNINPVQKEQKKALMSKLINIQKNIDSEFSKGQLDQKRLELLLQKRNDLDVEYTKLIHEIRQQNPQYAGLEYPEPMSLHKAQQMLDDHTTLLEYFIGKSHSFLFTISKDDVHSFDLPGEKKITGQVLKMRESLLNPKDNTYRATSLVLYSELIKPAEDQLKGKSRILIAPDGALNYLPFESLIEREMNQSSDIPFLALDFELQYVPSISVLKVIQEKQDPAGPKEFLAFANPLLNETTAKENQTAVRDWAGILGPLPNTKREVEEIAKMYTPENVSILIGKNASEKNVKDLKLSDYRKVHFASHGLIDEEKPEFSALVLSSDEKGQEDGFLTMREVFDLKLKADLVVLSACKTGLGENIRGEGVSGLSRSFLVAGASTVLVSLWNVYDKTTSDFMKAFYQNMVEKHMTKTEALKQVRTAMIQNPKSSHPYFWAPFVLIGEN